MNGSFWLGVLVGFLLGVIATAIAVFLFFVPVRRDVTPAAMPTTIEVVVESGSSPSTAGF